MACDFFESENTIFALTWEMNCWSLNIKLIIVQSKEDLLILQIFSAYTVDFLEIPEEVKMFPLSS
jgi:hypothetical protein